MPPYRSTLTYSTGLKYQLVAVLTFQTLGCSIVSFYRIPPPEDLKESSAHWRLSFVQEIRHPEDTDSNFDIKAETIQRHCQVCNPKDMDHTEPASLLLLAHLRELDNLRETARRMTRKEEEDLVLGY